MKSELELLLPGAGNWNTMFVADVLLLAEKNRANRDVLNIEFKNRHSPRPSVMLARKKKYRRNLAGCTASGKHFRNVLELPPSNVLEIFIEKWFSIKTFYERKVFFVHFFLDIM